MSKNYPDIARQYAESVVAGVIPACKWVIQACQRQLDDLARWSDGGPYHFDGKAASRICRFVELMAHVKGPLAGQNIALEPWQIFSLTTIFGWLRPNGQRRFRRAYIEVPRGNAKSTLSSGVALYMLAADEEGGAEVYSLATTRDQARIVFGDAQTMARGNPGFRKRFGVEVLAHAITQLSSGSKFQAMSAEGSTLDGLNIHFGCIDELHAHKTRDVYDVVETGTGKRDQSLLWVITTSGSNRAGICYEIRTFVTKLLDGVFEDDSQFGIIYTIDDGDDWTTEEALIKANPNWGVSVKPDVLLPLQAKAMQLPSAVNNFLTKHLNVWVSADAAWMDMRAWDRCANHGLTLDDFEGEECIAGLDLATKTDIAALVLLFKKDGRYYLFGRYYLPEDTVETSPNSQYSGWVRSGRLVQTPGAITDYDYIERDLLDFAARFRIREVAYDPYQATQFATRMSAQGLQMVEMRQIVATLSEPMKELEAQVLSGGLTHDGCPVMAWMMSNVVCHRDVKDNIYPRKERYENKIDGPVATITALARWTTCEPETRGYQSAYENEVYL